MSALYYDTFDSPIGPLTAAADAKGALRYILFPDSRLPPAEREPWHHEPDALLPARQQILEYLQGRRTQFRLDLAPMGSAFQLDVWHALAQIPYGETWSYAQMAHYVARPNACRAVGAANARNPLPIVLPCHRVIGSHGALTGYSGGLATKASLLRLEGIRSI